jgi:hypothetical protein
MFAVLPRVELKMFLNILQTETDPFDHLCRETI